MLALQLNTGNDRQEYCTAHVVRHARCLLAMRVGFDVSTLLIGGGTKHAWRMHIIHVQLLHIHGACRRMRWFYYCTSMVAALVQMMTHTVRGCSFVLGEGSRVQSSTEQKHDVMGLGSPCVMW